MSIPGMGHETVDLAADDTSSSDEALENDSEPLMEQIPNDDEAVPMDGAHCMHPAAEMAWQCCIIFGNNICYRVLINTFH